MQAGTKSTCRLSSDSNQALTETVAKDLEYAICPFAEIYQSISNSFTAKSAVFVLKIVSKDAFFRLPGEKIRVTAQNAPVCLCYNRTLHQIDGSCGSWTFFL